MAMDTRCCTQEETGGVKIYVCIKGVDLDKKVGGADWCVTQPFPAGELVCDPTFSSCNALKTRSLFGRRACTALLIPIR